MEEIGKLKDYADYFMFSLKQRSKEIEKAKKSAFVPENDVVEKNLSFIPKSISKMEKDINEIQKVKDATTIPLENSFDEFKKNFDQIKEDAYLFHKIYEKFGIIKGNNDFKFSPKSINFDLKNSEKNDDSNLENSMSDISKEEISVFSQNPNKSLKTKFSMNSVENNKSVFENSPDDEIKENEMFDKKMTEISYISPIKKKFSNYFSIDKKILDENSELTSPSNIKSKNINNKIRNGKKIKFRKNDVNIDSPFEKLGKSPTLEEFGLAEYKDSKSASGLDLSGDEQNVSFYDNSDFENFCLLKEFEKDLGRENKGKEDVDLKNRK